ncbi:MAG: hypothetical protein KC421_06010 [Anaerolineales bacterium]|nr:hypothetical protein [Anaerolineales bacterium]
MEPLPSSNLDLRTHSQILVAELGNLRNYLIQLGAWPEAGDALLDLIPLSRWDYIPLTDSDYSWLPSVVKDAANGKDIGAHYPSFFQKLLTNNDLRQMFLSELKKQAYIQ